MLDDQPIAHRIDLEKKAALSDAHILDYRKLNDTATNDGGNVYYIGIDELSLDVG